MHCDGKNICICVGCTFADDNLKPLSKHSQSDRGVANKGFQAFISNLQNKLC